MSGNFHFGHSQFGYDQEQNPRQNYDTTVCMASQFLLSYTVFADSGFSPKNTFNNYFVVYKTCLQNIVWCTCCQFQTCFKFIDVIFLTIQILLWKELNTTSYKLS